MQTIGRYGLVDTAGVGPRPDDAHRGLGRGRRDVDVELMASRRQRQLVAAAVGAQHVVDAQRGDRTVGTERVGALLGHFDGPGHECRPAAVVARRRARPVDRQRRCDRTVEPRSEFLDLLDGGIGGRGPVGHIETEHRVGIARFIDELVELARGHRSFVAPARAVGGHEIAALVHELGVLAIEGGLRHDISRRVVPGELGGLAGSVHEAHREEGARIEFVLADGRAET